MVHQQSNGNSNVRQNAKRRWIELGAPDESRDAGASQAHQPGPFGTRTRELGTFLEMRDAGKLVAMRLVHIPGFTEVSAVCTHPDHTGRGYAAELTLAVMDRIRQRGETPFLHVRGNNARAIPIYERLGFKQRTSFISR